MKRTSRLLKQLKLHSIMTDGAAGIGVYIDSIQVIAIRKPNNGTYSALTTRRMLLQSELEQFYAKFPRIKVTNTNKLREINHLQE